MMLKGLHTQNTPEDIVSNWSYLWVTDPHVCRWSRKKICKVDKYKYLKKITKKLLTSDWNTPLVSPNNTLTDIFHSSPSSIGTRLCITEVWFGEHTGPLKWLRC